MILASPPAPTDRRYFATLFTRARKRKGWTYTQLSAYSGVPLTTTARACRCGDSSPDTLLKLIAALGIVLALPEPPRVLSAREAQSGRSEPVLSTRHAEPQASIPTVDPRPYTPYSRWNRSGRPPLSAHEGHTRP